MRRHADAKSSHWISVSLATAWTLSLALAGIIAPTSLAQAEETATRRLWAYPRGVIVTTTVPALGRIKDASLRDDLEALAGHIEPEFAACLADLRDRRAELRGGPRVSLTLLLQIQTDGRIASIQPERKPPPEVVECTARAMVAAQKYKMAPLPPSPKSKPLRAHLVLDGVILTDEEAKGKGFLFYEAETRWERELRAHPEWIRCKKSSDCAVLAERCEVHSVHVDYVEAYRTALKARRERPCAEAKRIESAAQCLRSRCALKN